MTADILPDRIDKVLSEFVIPPPEGWLGQSLQLFRAPQRVFPVDQGAFPVPGLFRPAGGFHIYHQCVHHIQRLGFGAAGINFPKELFGRGGLEHRFQAHIKHNFGSPYVQDVCRVENVLTIKGYTPIGRDKLIVRVCPL